MIYVNSVYFGAFIQNGWQNRCVQFGGGGRGEGGGGGGGGEVVACIDGPHEALEWVIYWFLVKIADEKELVTDR